MSHGITQHCQMLGKQNMCQKNAHSESPWLAWPTTFVIPATGMPEFLPEL